MDCCYYCPPQQQCMSYGSECCTIQQHKKRQTMLERQGIWVKLNTPPATEDLCRPPELTKIWRPPPFICPKPPVEVFISVDTDGPFVSSHSNLNLNEGKIVRNVLWMTDSRYYDKNRGPILRIRGQTIETILTYKEFLKLGENGEPIEAQMEDYSEFYPEVEDLFVFEEMEPFATTTRCKQIKHITVKNEGTTAIRYQWLRSPPTRALRRILGRPGSIINLRNHKPPKDDPFFWKDTCFEFHFRELPGVILPGQSVEFPVTFRPRKPGYYHEKLYLMTHPRLSDEDDKVFNLRLSGICMEPDCPLPHSKSPLFGKENTCSVDGIARKIKGKILFQEAMDGLYSILDNVLYDRKAPKSTLPLGKLTVEKIFYTHNRDLHYHYGPAEKSLESVRDLVRQLVPKDRVIGNENFCPLSLQSLYNEIARTPTQGEPFASNFKSPETEEKMEKLAESNRRLAKPRVFSWPSIDRRINSSCYSTMVAVMDEIVARIENVDFDAKNPDMDKVFRAEVKDKLVKKKMRAERRLLKKQEKIRRLQSVETEDAEEEGTYDEFSSGKLEKSIRDPGRKTTRKGVSTANTLNSSNRTNSSQMIGAGDNFEMLGEDEMDGEGREMERPTVYQISEAEIEAALDELKTRKVKQGKRVLFETLFGCGVERMMSVVDSFRNMYDYRGSDVIRYPESVTCSKH